MVPGAPLKGVGGPHPGSPQPQTLSLAQWQRQQRLAVRTAGVWSQSGRASGLGSSSRVGDGWVLGEGHSGKLGDSGSVDCPS